MGYKKIFVSSFVSLLISNVSFFYVIYPVLVGWIFNAVFLLNIVFLFPVLFEKSTRNEKAYLFIMLVGLLFHLFIPSIKKPIYDACRWIFIVVLLIESKSFKSINILNICLFVFFIFNCLIAIYEKLYQVHLVDYQYVEGFMEIYDNNLQFRAFGLMEHPLFSANVVLIILSWIIISVQMNVYFRYFLLFIGSCSLFCFNSRAALLIWVFILLYRFFFSKFNPVSFFILCFCVYIFFFDDSYSHIFQKGLGAFGRLNSKNFSDESSLTRILSFAVFGSYNWKIEDILFGGVIMYLPGTKISLENGILLTIAWWGWFVGVLKVLLEILLSWNVMKGFRIEDKLIVFSCTWICANANNNISNTFVFSFFVMCFIVFRCFKEKVKNTV